MIGLTTDIQEIEVEFNRTLPSDFEDIVVALNGVTFISDETKIKKAGLDYDVELERLAEQAERTGIVVGDEEARTDIVGETDSGIALNGAQITAIKDLAKDVALGNMPRGEAVQMAMLLGLDKETAEKVIPEQGDAEASKIE